MSRAPTISKANAFTSKARISFELDIESSACSLNLAVADRKSVRTPYKGSYLVPASRPRGRQDGAPSTPPGFHDRVLLSSDDQRGLSEAAGVKCLMSSQ